MRWRRVLLLGVAVLACTAVGAAVGAFLGRPVRGVAGGAAVGLVVWAVLAE